jgi:hypothetical protein
MINENGDTWMLVVFLIASITFVVTLASLLIGWLRRRRAPERQGYIVR